MKMLKRVSGEVIQQILLKRWRLGGEALFNRIIVHKNINVMLKFSSEQRSGKKIYQTMFTVFKWFKVKGKGGKLGNK